jgi:ABC-type multidrug transport system fused ATPase/permease subunit
MRVVGFLLEELPRSVVAHDRLKSVLDVPSEQPPVQGRRPLPDGPLSVEVEGLSFGFGGEPVLDDLRFRVEPGEIVALVGSTGEGKTTLCNLLARLIVPAAGHLRLGDVPVEEIDGDDLREHVALVFQESFLFADTVRENVTLGRPFPDDELLAVLDVAQARSVVERLPRRLDEVIGERGVTLSGGQRQRLALARALLRRPRLLLLDDATSAVDPTIERRILDGLRDTLATTTIVVAHRVATIMLADRVLYLDGGRIVASGRHEDLLQEPGYEALVRAYEQEPVRP